MTSIVYSQPCVLVPNGNVLEATEIVVMVREDLPAITNLTTASQFYCRHLHGVCAVYTFSLCQHSDAERYNGRQSGRRCASFMRALRTSVAIGDGSGRIGQRSEQAQQRDILTRSVNDVNDVTVTRSFVLRAWLSRFDNAIKRRTRLCHVYAVCAS